MTDKSKIAQVGRLALRHEGEMWNAYYAEPGTMKDAILLGSVSIGLVAGKPERMREFQLFMRDVVGDIIEETTGIRPVWPDEPVPAPEHERGGHA